MAPSGSHYITVRGEHPLRLHPSCVLYTVTGHWPAWILFTRVLSSDGDSALSRMPAEVGAGRGDPTALSTATSISQISVINPEWLIELAPHYFTFGTDREHLEASIKSND
ncbi:unnamed protein product [Protopolystoma xenopodis]|uniref:DEAD-box helicase OB fold domain-containing protein n=1 Tax=Protopolystoma xenopodis TaxID=117903 RepID=A0A3S5AJS8_9PLAT|nr:unnamed protein product [Protopolystoma xenopodis]